MLSFLVERERQVRLVCQALPHEARERASRTDFEEDARAIGIHLLHQILETHGMGQLLGQQLTNLLSLPRIDLGRRVGVNRDLRSVETDPFEMGPKRLHRGSDQRRVERRGNRQPPESDLGLFQVRLYLFQGLQRPGEDYLIRAVDVGQRNIGSPGAQLLCQRLGRREGRRHTARDRGDVSHEFPPFARHQKQVFRLFDDARCVEGHQLPVAVPGGEQGLQVQPLQQVQLR